MSLTDKERAEVEAQVKKRLGIKVSLKDLNITAEQIENGILSLLDAERSRKKTKYSTIWVRGYLVEKKHLLTRKMEVKMRFETIWVNKEGNLCCDAEPRKLSSYTSVDQFGHISRVLKDMLMDAASHTESKCDNHFDISMFFQFKIENDEPRLSVTFTKGKNPKNVIDTVDFSTIF